MTPPIQLVTRLGECFEVDPQGKDRAGNRDGVLHYFHLNDLVKGTCIAQGVLPLSFSRAARIVAAKRIAYFRFSSIDGFSQRKRENRIARRIGHA